MGWLELLDTPVRGCLIAATIILGIGTVLLIIITS